MINRCLRDRIWQLTHHSCAERICSDGLHINRNGPVAFERRIEATRAFRLHADHFDLAILRFVLPPCSHAANQAAATTCNEHAIRRSPVRIPFQRSSSLPCKRSWRIKRVHDHRPCLGRIGVTRLLRIIIPRPADHNIRTVQPDCRDLDGG